MKDPGEKKEGAEKGTTEAATSGETPNQEGSSNAEGADQEGEKE